MGKIIRIIIAVVLVVGLVVIASGNAAWAANQGAASDQAPADQTQLTAARDDDCKKKDKDTGKKDKKKDKDKDKCKDDDDDDDDDDDGTVRPPGDDNDVCDRNLSSVGGAATVEAKRLKKGDCFRARAENPATLGVLSGGAYQSDALVLDLPASGGKIKVCFAAPPGKKVKIHASVGGSWTPVKTTVKNGLACAEVDKSGAYALAGR